MSEAYELLFEVKSSGEAALDQIQSKIRGVDAAGKSAAGSVDGLTNNIQAAVAAINANTAAVNALTKGLDGVSVSSRSAATGLDGVSRAAGRVTGEAQMATAALRELDGSFNMRSAGRFLTVSTTRSAAAGLVFSSSSAARRKASAGRCSRMRSPRAIKPSAHRAPAA